MLADDITASTFEKCWHALPAFRPRKVTVRPWLFRIAANELASHYRSESRRVNREHLAVVRDERLRDADARWGGDGELVAALSKLGERQQMVLSLRFLADLSTEEAADAIGVSRGHFAVLQHRSLAALRHQLEGGTSGR